MSSQPNLNSGAAIRIRAMLLLLLAGAGLGVSIASHGVAVAEPKQERKALKKAVVTKAKQIPPGQTALRQRAIIQKRFGPKSFTKSATVHPSNGAGALTKTSVTKTGVPKAGFTKTGFTKTGLSKTGLTKAGAAQPGLTKAGLARNPFTKAGRPATIGARLRLRADHRTQLLAARRLLPQRPYPGQRGFTGVPPVGETRFISTEMVLQVGPNVSRQAVEAAMARHGMTILAAQTSPITGGTIYQCRVAGGRQVVEAVRAFEAERFGTAQPNYVYLATQDQTRENASEDDTTLAARTDTGGSTDQYVISKLHLADVHRIATGNKVLVAVIDSAIDTRHPDLGGAIAEEFDAVGRRDPPHTHGTGMAGAIVAHRRLMGIAPGARILAVHAFSTSSQQTPEATTRNILAGIDWAIAKGARVINMSFAGPYDPMLQVAMKNAAAKGVVLIAAAGNAGPKSPPLYPAADPNVIAVTATDEHDKLFTQANQGPYVAVAAPGVDVTVPAPNNTYQLTTGTSVAAAHVSGVAALLIERYPTVSAQTVLEVLTATAQKVGAGRNDQYGWGLIDPAAALDELDVRMADSKVATTARPPAAPKATPVSAR